MSNESFASRLKAETDRSHRRIEACDYFKALFEGTLPRIAYEEYLISLRDIFEFLEGRLSESECVEVRSLGKVFAEHHRALREDLSALEVRGEPGPLQDFMNRLETPSGSELLGVCYVFLGSGHGAPLLKRQLVQVYGDDVEVAYLTHAGETIRGEWPGFRNLLDRLVVTESDQQRVIATANETFEGFRRILEECVVRSSRTQRVDLRQ